MNLINHQKNARFICITALFIDLKTLIKYDIRSLMQIIEMFGYCIDHRRNLSMYKYMEP